MTSRARGLGRIGVGIRAGTARGGEKSKPSWHSVDVELTDPRDHSGERLIALKFRLHLVGDLPQPFHSADAGDASGNRMRIVAGGFRLGNLHHFWDTERVARLGVPLEAADERR
jgi:hypothetical protein